ncbi:MAG TPA: helix-turn-helix domain-containing protein [Pseudomonadales bacterium]|nr:helix-turn-helix domain-containing protein [Pseudomonadales bacterium]
MSQIPVASLNPARLLMQEKSLDLNELYALCNVTREQFEQKDCWVPVESLVNSLSLVEKYSDGQPLSLLLTDYIPMTAFGDFGIATLSAPSYGEALNLLIEFGHIIAPGMYFTSTRTVNYLTVHIRNEGFFGRYSEAMTELALLQIRKYLPQPQLSSLLVRHAPNKNPAISARLQPFFDFNAEENSISFPSAVLEQKLMLSEPTMFSASVKAVRDMEVLKFINKPYVLQVKNIISDFLAEGEAVTLERVSLSMCVTPRTLSRKLKWEDSNFKELLNATRMDVAKQLVERKMSLKVISARLGFRSVKGFVQAFERTTGSSPAVWRDKS